MLWSGPNDIFSLSKIVTKSMIFTNVSFGSHQSITFATPLLTHLKFLGLIFRVGRRNALKLSSGSILGLLSGLGPEIRENCPLEFSWAYFPGWGQKCFKTVLWKPPGLTFRAGARNASKQSSGSLLGARCSGSLC
jgi:hypothetical protein